MIKRARVGGLSRSRARRERISGTVGRSAARLIRRPLGPPDSFRSLCPMSPDAGRRPTGPGRLPPPSTSSCAGATHARSAPRNGRDRGRPWRARSTPQSSSAAPPRRGGVHEVHYSMVVILAMGIGLFAPPFGVGYYAACAISRIHPDEGMKPIIGYMLALLIGTI